MNQKKQPRTTTEKMRDTLEDSWIYEAVGVLLIGAAVFLIVSLVSYQQADNFVLQGMRIAELQNAGGVVGAYIAYHGLFILGWGIFVIPLLLFILGFLFLFLHDVRIVWIRFASIVVFLVLTCILLQLIQDGFGVDGSKSWGGVIGAFLSSFLVAYLSRFGAFVLTISLLLVALLAFSSFSLQRLIVRMLAAMVSLIRQSGIRWKTWHSVRRQKAGQRRAERERQQKDAARQKSDARSGKTKRNTTVKPKVTWSPVHQTSQRSVAEQSRAPAAITGGEDHQEGENEQISVLETQSQIDRGQIELLDDNGEIDCLVEEIGPYILPGLNLLHEPERVDRAGMELELEERSAVLQQKLMDFKIEGQVTHVSPGPVVTTFEFEPAPGVKISRIIGLSDDLAMALKATVVPRVAPVPGKAVVGIELPNSYREVVTIKDIIGSPQFEDNPSLLKVALGKDTAGNPMVSDLTAMPHLLIAGATGSGKSVCINSVIVSLLYTATPELLRLLLIDPKRLELSDFNGLPHLREPVVTDPRMAPEALDWAVHEMEQRYELLARSGVRNIRQYNKVVRGEMECRKVGQERPTELMPYIVIIIDELADLMMVSSHEVEDGIARLAQMARAAGMHLILATQRPSVDVITGLIKANMPCRISFQVSSKIDSRTILDTIGSEKLLGQGDMLFLPPRTSKLRRIHGAFVSEEEVKKVVRFWEKQQRPVEEESIFKVHEELKRGEMDTERDPLYDKAVRLVIQTGIASISLLQRRLRIGHSRAARLIDVMEQTGIVGPFDGSKPREVLVEPEFLERLSQGEIV